MGEAIGILSLKGGVGKTSTVTSLGSAIADMGKKVLLIDGNLSAPDLGVHLNVINPDVTLHHVLDGKAVLKDSIQKLDDLNLDLLPSAIFYRKKINPLKLKDSVKKLKRTYDYIIIDSSPALNDETLAVMMAADRLFVVTTPDYPTLSMTIKALKDAKSRGIKIDGIILNRVYNKSFEIPVKDVEETLEIPVLAVIPHDTRVVKSASEFTPAFMQSPRSKGSREYRKFAGTITGEKYDDPMMGVRRFMKITPRQQDVNREIYYKSVFE